GWIVPPSLCAANLAASGDRLTSRFGQSVARIERTADLWRLLGPTGAEIAAAPILILANGTGITAFPEAAALPVVSARGQISHLSAVAGSSPRVVVCRQGYVTPEIDGWRCAGASFQVDDPDSTLRQSDHAENLAKIDFMLPGHPGSAAIHAPAGRVGFRPASPDRLPMVGAVPRAERPDASCPLEALPRQPGLYAVSGFGARGLVWSALMAEWLASSLSGDPLPFEHSLGAAIDPARYLLRPARQRVSDE
ncbi:MAG: FAD-dependent 5-carboxymethylaminomethyl-2-thiouridine(34) oxidoreductase MnmC, partial [Zoogloeaceae bacterium]|nr:FAD-dependent 5-carboxymethylaminomethyl-2-thiouridine(34) oxidoreductase MnmC [Zoogloeaceae bacterium]